MIRCAVLQCEVLPSRTLRVSSVCNSLRGATHSLERRHIEILVALAWAGGSDRLPCAVASAHAMRTSRSARDAARNRGVTGRRICNIELKHKGSHTFDAASPSLRLLRSAALPGVGASHQRALPAVRALQDTTAHVATKVRVLKVPAPKDKFKLEASVGV